MKLDDMLLRRISSLPREACVNILNSIAIECFENEGIDVLRGAVIANLEDETIDWIDLGQYW